MNNIWVQIFFLFFYGVANWVTHTLIVSIIVFFHFLLDHQISIIDDWIFKNAWNITILSKIIAAIFLFKFITVKSNKRAPFRELIGNGLIIPSKEIWIIISFLLVFFFTFRGDLIEQIDKFQASNFLESTYGILLFYGVEIFNIYTLNFFYPLPDDKKPLYITIYALIFSLHNKMTLFYAEGLDIYVFSNILLLAYLIFWDRLNWSIPALLTLLYVGPIGNIFGLDPLWASHFSIFSLQQKIEIPVYFAILFVPMIYLHIKNKSDKRSQPL